MLGDYRAPRGYAIPDEPSPGRLQSLAVTPFATFLGLMLGGVIVGLPWMVLNAYAIGSATRRRETVYAAATLVSMFAVLGLVIWLLDTHRVPQHAAPYLGLLVHAVRFTGAYAIYLTQAQSFELYQHFGGRVSRYGAVIAFGLLVLRSFLVDQLGDGWIATIFLF
jgi:hypothetical protein